MQAIQTTIEKNFYGFTQKRMSENLAVESFNKMKPLVQEQIFNPMSTEYGRVTKYLALDCEMDQGNFKNIPCKATVVNQRGEIVLDTLIFDEGQRVRSLQQIQNPKTPQ